jgi:hypothetical protein
LAFFNEKKVIFIFVPSEQFVGSKICNRAAPHVPKERFVNHSFYFSTHQKILTDLKTKKANQNFDSLFIFNSVVLV